MKKEISGISIELRQGDITRHGDCEAVVNAANAHLKNGGGVAGAIHSAAGPELEKEAVPLGSIKPGEAVITGAYGLPNKYIIHCLGPVYGKDKPEDQLLASCYTNALALAEDNMVSSIAFPAISTGIFGYPVEEASKVAFSAVIQKAPSLKHLKHIVFVLYSDRDLEVHEKSLEQILKWYS